MNPFQDQATLAQVQRMESYATPSRPPTHSGRGAWAMAWLHLVIWHSWKGTYFYADKFTEDDYENYRQYALLSFTFLADHHDAEEKYLFPALEKRVPGFMKTNHEQHDSFLKELTDIIRYLTGADSKDKFDASTFRAKLDEIVLPVMEHLADELDTLKGPLLLEKFTEEELAVINKETHLAQEGNGDKSKLLPFILQNLPQPSPFPPAPGFVKTIIAPWMMYWKYKPLWKYATFPYSSSLPPVPEDGHKTEGAAGRTGDEL